MKMKSERSEKFTFCLISHSSTLNKRPLLRYWYELINETFSIIVSKSILNTYTYRILHNHPHTANLISRMYN